MQYLAQGFVQPFSHPLSTPTPNQRLTLIQINTPAPSSSDLASPTLLLALFLSCHPTATPNWSRRQEPPLALPSRQTTRHPIPYATLA
jgi:hypothetical protein